MFGNIIRLTKQLKYINLGDVPMLARIARSYLMLLSGRRTGRCVDILIDYDCQCRCEHCLTGTNLGCKVERPLSTDEWKAFIDDCARMGFFHFNFSGGEPLMAEKTYELISYLAKKHMLVSVNTNGLMLSEENLKRLKKCGLKTIQVSIDHSLSERHDQYRRYEGLHKEAMAGARRARDMGFTVSINSMATGERIKSGDVVKHCEQVRKEGFTYQLEIPCIAGNYSTDKSMLLNEAERKTYWSYVKELGMRNDHQSTYWTQGCDAGSEKITVTPDGEIMPCSVIWISFGNIRNESLKTIWDRMCSVKWFSKIQPLCLSGMEEEFIDTCLLQLSKAEKLPMRWDKHPAIKKLVKD